MANIKDIKLTDDPLTNIHIMTPYLDDVGRVAVSALMFGVVLGQEMEKESVCLETQEKALSGIEIDSKHV